MRVIRDTIGAVACGSLLALLLGGCAATASAKADEPTACEECRTDAECERLCGGEYDDCLGYPPVCPFGFTPVCSVPSGWACVKVAS